MNKQIFVLSMALLVASLSQAAWFTSNPLTVDCERPGKKGQVLMSVVIRGNVVTIKDNTKSEEVTHTTRVTQSNRSKHWSNQQIEMTVGLKPSRAARIFGGGDYHTGSLEFKSLPESDDNRYLGFYCFPQEIVQ
jgi:hypothetical protein